MRSASDRRLAALIRRLQDLPGQHLFDYTDDEGTVQEIDSADVNAYLREVSETDITAKDFRTWAGTVLAYGDLAGERSPGSDAEAVRITAAVVRDVATRLGNTAAVCRKSYIHPAVIEAYRGGRLEGRPNANGPNGSNDDPSLETAVPRSAEMPRRDLERAVLDLLRSESRRLRGPHR